MRKQLEVDIKGCLNKDLADQIKKALEDLDALQTAYNSLVAQLEADKADISSTDFASEAVTPTIDID